MKKNFKLLGLAAIAVLTTLFSCDEDENNNPTNNVCNVSNPIEELAWLKEKIDNVEDDQYSFYNMATYHKETVFYYGNCNPSTNYVSIIRNCTGDSLALTNDVFDELTEISTLWKSENSLCNSQD